MSLGHVFVANMTGTWCSSPSRGREPGFSPESIGLSLVALVVGGIAADA